MISNEVLREIDFIKRAKKITVHNSSTIEKNLISNNKSLNTINKNDKEIFVCLIHEHFSNKNILNSIIDFLDDKKVEYKIMSSTSTKFKNSTNPLTNILVWNGTKIHKFVHGNLNEEIDIFSSKIFKLNKDINKDRLYRGILSIRKQTPNRDYFFKKYNPKVTNGITRYCELPHRQETTNLDISEIPSWYELIMEYDKCYFSFIIESKNNKSQIYYDDFTHQTDHTSLTEKTLLGFMTGTMPIVFGGPNFVKTIEDMGLKVWNNEFGFDNADSKTDYSENGWYYFNKCIDIINKLSMNDIKNIWNDNLETIQKNYDIVSSIVIPDEYNFYNLINKKIM